ncbi:MAG: outer membrane beta-barrel protein [Alloprevotella sp.]
MTREFFSVLCLATAACTATAQTGGDKTLGEAVVEAKRWQTEGDGYVYRPSAKEKSQSATVFDLMDQIALPGISIDRQNKTATTADGRGRVMIRIDGVEADRQDLLALDPVWLTKLKISDKPGVRYTDDVRYVIDLTTKITSAWSAGTDQTDALTAARGNHTVYGRWQTQRREGWKNTFAVNYTLDYANDRRTRTDETAHYHLIDGNIKEIRRNDIDRREEQWGHTAALKYTLADSTRHVFQAKLSLPFNHTPVSRARKLWTDGLQTDTTTAESHNRSASPALNLFYKAQPDSARSLTLDAVGTLINTRYSNFSDEGSTYAYDVRGRSMSFIGEAIYEHRLRPFTLTAGVNYLLKYTNNSYEGQVVSTTPIHHQNLYAFAAVAGKTLGVDYKIGMGLTRLSYRQTTHRYNFLLPRPRLDLTLPLPHGLSLNYTLEMSDHVSRIATVNETMIRRNSMEWEQGNPDLRPNRVWEQSLRLSLNHRRLFALVEAYYKSNRHPNMAAYTRTADDRFIYTQRNQDKIDAVMFIAYARLSLIPDCLRLNLTGQLFRCLNFGDDYTHHRTYPIGSAELTGRFGHIDLTAGAYSGWRFIEGESEGLFGNNFLLSGGYTGDGWRLSLSLANPFGSRHLVNETNLYSRYIQRHVTTHNEGRQLTLGFTWRIGRGKTDDHIATGSKLKDNDGGVVTQ